MAPSTAPPAAPTAASCLAGVVGVAQLENVNAVAVASVNVISFFIVVWVGWQFGDSLLSQSTNMYYGQVNYQTRFLKNYSHKNILCISSVLVILNHGFY